MAAPWHGPRARLAMLAMLVLIALLPSAAATRTCTTTGVRAGDEDPGQVASGAECEGVCGYPDTDGESDGGDPWCYIDLSSDSWGYCACAEEKEQAGQKEDGKSSPSHVSSLAPSATASSPSPSLSSGLSSVHCSGRSCCTTSSLSSYPGCTKCNASGVCTEGCREGSYYWDAGSKCDDCPIGKTTTGTGKGGSVGKKIDCSIAVVQVFIFVFN